MLTTLQDKAKMFKAEMQRAAGGGRATKFF
jgi:hypothetical protein